jgi:hypothetical protein
MKTTYKIRQYIWDDCDAMRCDAMLFPLLYCVYKSFCCCCCRCCTLLYICCTVVLYTVLYLACMCLLCSFFLFSLLCLFYKSTRFVFCVVPLLCRGVCRGSCRRSNFAVFYCPHIPRHHHSFIIHSRPPNRKMTDQSKNWAFRHCKYRGD